VCTHGYTCVTACQRLALCWATHAPAEPPLLSEPLGSVLFPCEGRPRCPCARALAEAPEPRAAARRPAAALRPERVWAGGRRYACLALHTQPLRGLWRPRAPSPVPVPPDTSPGTDVAAAAGLGAVRPPRAGGHCHGYRVAIP